MTIGIYCISFNGLNDVYIGQSNNIEKRWNTHKRSFINNTANNKLTNAYIKYGTPTYSIIAECELDELNAIETIWINEFDSKINGLNVLYSWNAGKSGYESMHSIYTREQVIKVFNMLIDTDYIYSIKEIEIETKVPKATIADIYNGNTHIWLKEEFPELYDLINDNRDTRFQERHNSKTAESKGIIYPIVLDTLGIEYNISNTHKFAKEHGLNQANLHALLTGKANSCKGYILKDSPFKKVIKIKGPDNIIYTLKSTAADFSREHNIGTGQLSRVIKGTQKSAKGFTLYIE
jgi:hypothetical protein